MNKRMFLGLLAIVAAAAAGFFLWTRSQNVVFEGTPASPVLVDIITPTNGTTISKGQTLSILAQAWSPNPVAEMQLWEDGEMISSENISEQDGAVNYSWDLDPSELGVHTYFVRASDSEGETGQSQTLILNVAAGGFQQVSAAAGDTLASIGGQNGFEVGDVAALNPGLEPDHPLADGQPVILPPASEGGGESTSLESAGIKDLVIKWQFTPTGEVHNSYCYQSIGGEDWQRVPGSPFSFMPGNQWLQTSFVLPAVQQIDLFLECWGWEGGTLKYLGEGSANLDFAQIPDELAIIGESFQANGIPEYKPLHGDLPEGVEIPAPFALREPESVTECASHGVSTHFCEQFMNGSSQSNVYIWEWSPGVCWGPCPVDHVDGYRIWEVDPSNQVGVTFKDVLSGWLKIATFPHPWGERCYEVAAFVDTLNQGRVYSPSTSYCGEQPEPETTVLKPSVWQSSEGMWINQGCDNWADAFRLQPSSSQLVVGFFYFGVQKYCDIKQGGATAAVQFSNVDLVLPPEAVMQRATLKFASAQVALEGPGSPSSYLHPGSCATRVGKAKSDWTALVASYSGSFLIHPDTLGPYYTPYASIGSPWSGQKSVDVTSAVLEWMDNPSSNHGFILIADLGDLYDSFVFEPGWDVKICYSLLDNVELEIDYFPPN